MSDKPKRRKLDSLTGEQQKIYKAMKDKHYKQTEQLIADQEKEEHYFWAYKTAFPGAGPVEKVTFTTRPQMGEGGLPW